MKLWVARDWFNTMFFFDKPKLIKVNDKKEWMGRRAMELECIMDMNFKTSVEVEAEPFQVEIIVNKCENEDSNY